MTAMIRQLIGTAAHIWQTTPEKITSKDRHRTHVLPRHAVCLVARQAFGCSLPAIALAIGGRDHTSVIYALDNASALEQHDSAYRDRVARLRAAAEQLAQGQTPLPMQVHETPNVGRLAARLRELAQYEPARFEYLKAEILQ